jgi:hypothetical protein
MEQAKQLRHWHLLFQLSLEEALQKLGELEIRSEFSLSTLPMRIDFIIVQSDLELLIHHPIAQQFRKYNIIEYKSPDDRLHPNDFHKGKIYVRLHQILFNPDDFHLQEASLTFICTRRPNVLFKRLDEGGYTVTKNYPIRGIYQITDEDCPIQIVVLNEVTDLDILYPFAPFLTGKRLGEEKVFVRLLKEGVDNPENKRVHSLIAYSLQYGVLSEELWKEVMQMLSPEEIAYRKRRYVEILEEHELGQEIKRRGRREGLRQGRKEGRKEGKEKAKREVVEMGLRYGWDHTSLARLTGFTDEEILQVQTSLTV